MSNLITCMSEISDLHIRQIVLYVESKYTRKIRGKFTTYGTEISNLLYKKKSPFNRAILTYKLSRKFPYNFFFVLVFVLQSNEIKAL